MSKKKNKNFMTWYCGTGTPNAVSLIVEKAPLFLVSSLKNRAQEIKAKYNYQFKN